MRIQKYLSEQGILSRRETEDYILKGRIKLNGVIVRELGIQIDPSKDKIEVLGGMKKDTKRTVLFYKPRGIVSSKNESEGETIFSAFPQYKDLNAIGRLDKESEGLILLSNDGVITAVVTGTHAVEKEYEVTTREKITNWHIKKLEEGILLDHKKTLPAKGEILSPHSFSIILREGRTHQIRRMADALHLTVIRLIRVRIGKLTTRGLSAGKSRALTSAEITSLKQLKKTISYAR